MSSDVALRVRGLGKSYSIRHKEHDHVTLAQSALHRVRHPRRGVERETFWALKDVSFDVPRGEVLGVIGRNGAGKSTLLKVLSRITAPTEGSVEVFGRVGSLLEVGTGFHPELTGRENVYLNGAILGMKRGEIDKQFDAIVDFAGVEQFLDTPVKRYSSGMYVRLAFAVAAHLDTEILLVDEVLAVGDTEFQSKCLGKIRDVASQGRTVILVSHNLDSVVRLCARAALLDGGTLIEVSSAHVAAERYGSLFSTRMRDLLQSHRRGTGEFRVTRAEAKNAPYTCAAEKRIRFAVQKKEGDLDRYFVGAHIVDEMRRVVAQCDSRLSGVWGHHDYGDSEFELIVRSPWLRPGRYSVDLYVCNAGMIDECDGACTFEVKPELPYRIVPNEESIFHNLVLPDFDFLVDSRHPSLGPANNGAVFGT